MNFGLIGIYDSNYFKWNDGNKVNFYRRLVYICKNFQVEMKKIMGYRISGLGGVRKWGMQLGKFNLMDSEI